MIYSRRLLLTLNSSVFLHVRRVRPRNFPSDQTSTCSVAQTSYPKRRNRSPELRHSPCFSHVSDARRKRLHSMRHSTDGVHRRLKSSTCLESRVRHPLLFVKRLGSLSVDMISTSRKCLDVTLPVSTSIISVEMSRSRSPIACLWLFCISYSLVCVPYPSQICSAHSCLICGSSVPCSYRRDLSSRCILL